MRFFKRTGLWKNSTESCSYNPATREGYSYKWWKVTEVKHGVTVFNVYSYSNSTAKHQRNLRAFTGFNTLDIPAPNGLGKPDMFTHMKDLIVKATAKLDNPRVKKATKFEAVDGIRKALATYEAARLLYKELDAPKLDSRDIEAKLEAIERMDPNKAAKFFKQDVKGLINE